jgi:signal peptidase I
VIRQKAYELHQAGDTISKPLDQIKQQGYHIHTNSIRQRDIYIKRCVGIPGDKVQIKEGVLYVNDQKSPDPKNILLIYAVTMSDSLPLDESVLMEYGIEKMGKINGHPNIHLLRMSHEALIKFGTLPRVVNIGRYTYPPNTEMYPVPIFFPNNFQYYNWNTDNFGPLTIPQKGMKLVLNDSTLCQYRRLIEVYEGNKLEQKDGKIYINGTETDEYTCKQDYYWMMGDNRYNAYDSRFWGFVPADHIAAKPLFILFSKNPNAVRPMDKIRWSRTFNSIPD